MLHEFGLGDEFLALLYRGDELLAEAVAAAGCPHCGGPLHQAKYPRKPRGGRLFEALGAFTLRRSMCCGHCRRRSLPPSLLFLGTRPADRVPPTRDGVDRLSYRRSHAPSRPLQVSTVPPSLCRGLGEAGLGVGGQWRRRRDVRRPEGSLRAGLEVVAVETPRDPDAARPQRPSPRAR